MKLFSKLQEKLKGLTDAISRYPLTTLFLLIGAAVNAVGINTNEDYSKYLLTFLVGAFLSAVLQVTYERFFYKLSKRLLLMAIVILLTIGYYLTIINIPKLSMEVGIRTAVALFALLFAFIWIPVIKSKISFNKSFMITFKSFFNALLYSGVLYLGLMIIIGAIDQLIFTIDYKAYPHMANIVFVIFAPMYFLSLIPIYPGEAIGTAEENLEEIEENADCPKFLEVLISYILIPLISIFTLILLIYLLTNISGEFWTDNLLEPMLVSYAITVILVYILASEIENKFTVLFRKIFPKVLIPIVVFQIIASVLRIGDTGITHGRYYVILFGIFAAIVGILLSFLPVRKNGIIAALIIVFSFISIVPPVDAFSVSKSSQINLIEDILNENQMLEDGKIKPNSSISNKDKQSITSIMSYLNRMDYIEEMEWLPEDFDYYQDFHDTFGFNEYYGEEQMHEGVYIGIDTETPISITGYDTLIFSNIYAMKDSKDSKVTTFEKDGKTYSLAKEVQDDWVDIIVTNENGEELIRYHTKDIFDHFYEYDASKGIIPTEEATFDQENDKAALRLVIQNLNIDKMQDEDNYMMDYYIFVKIK